MAGIDSFVVFGCHYNDGNGVASSTDFSTAQAAKTITFNGGATCSTGASKFGASVLALVASTSSYLELSDHANWDKDLLGAYTAETFIRPAAVNAFYYIMGNGDKSAGGTAEGWSLYIDSDANIYFRLGGGGLTTINAAHGMSATTWYHAAWDVGVDGVYRVYVDGAVKATSAANTLATSAANPFRIGRVAVLFEFNGYFDGYHDEARVSKGVQRYGGAFTPPTAEFSAGSAYISKMMMMGLS